MVESTSNKKWVLHICVITVWIIYCYFYWSFFSWDKMKKKLSLQENRWVKGVCYVLVELITISWSMFVDIFPALGMVPILIFALSLFLFTQNFEEMDDDRLNVSLRDSLHHCMRSLIVPIASKFFSSVFEDHRLNIFFCFLYSCIVVIKELDMNINPPYSENSELFILAMTVFTLILMYKIRLQNKSYTRDRNFNSCRWLWLLKKPLIFNVALCSFLHRFERTIMMHDYMNTYPNIIPTVMQYSHRCYNVSGLFSCWILLLIITSHQNRIIECLYNSQFLFYPVLFVSVILLHYKMTSISHIVVLGIYFPTLETFLAGPVTVRAGNYYNGCGAAAMAFINSCMHLGEVVALILLYVVPTMKLYTTLICLIVFAHFFHKLYKCKNDTLLQM